MSLSMLLSIKDSRAETTPGQLIDMLASRLLLDVIRDDSVPITGAYGS
jgi:hypothetical protein